MKMKDCNVSVERVVDIVVAILNKTDIEVQSEVEKEFIDTMVNLIGKGLYYEHVLESLCKIYNQ